MTPVSPFSIAKQRAQKREGKMKRDSSDFTGYVALIRISQRRILVYIQLLLVLVLHKLYSNHRLDNKF
jgi:hypothetical protein